MNKCGIWTCERPSHGTIPKDSPVVKGKAEVIIGHFGDERSRVCLEHGWEHHDWWEKENPNSTKETVIYRVLPS